MDSKENVYHKQNRQIHRLLPQLGGIHVAFTVHAVCTILQFKHLYIESARNIHEPNHEAQNPFNHPSGIP